MEEAKYSVEIRGSFGPFGLRRLQEFVNSGQITPTTPLFSTRGHRIQASALHRLRFDIDPADASPDPDLVRRFTVK